MCFIRLPEVRFSAPNKATWWVHGHAMVGSLDLIDAANSTEIETTQWGPQSGNKITFYRTFTRLLPFYCLLVGHTLGFFSVLSFFFNIIVWNKGFWHWPSTFTIRITALSPLLSPILPNFWYSSYKYLSFNISVILNVQNKGHVRYLGFVTFILVTFIMNTIDVELFVSIKQLPVKSDSKLTAKKLYSDTIQRSKDE